MLQDCHDLLTLTEWKDITITNNGDEMSCMQVSPEWKLGKVKKIMAWDFVILNRKKYGSYCITSGVSVPIASVSRFQVQEIFSLFMSSSLTWSILFKWKIIYFVTKQLVIKLVIVAKLCVI